MSPTVNNFVHDLVAMAKAMDDLPQVQEALDVANCTIEIYAKQVQEREIRILELKSEIEAHLATIRSLEVAKDAAETMFLEADDRTTRALDFIKAQFGAAGSLIQSLEPPRPEPVIEEAPQVALHQPKPIPTIVEDGVMVQSPAMGLRSDTPQQGQSEADPTTDAPSGESEDSVNSSVTTQDVTSATSSPGPYHGHRYVDVLGFVSRLDWLDGGGTNEDYDWRPGDAAEAMPF